MAGENLMARSVLFVTKQQHAASTRYRALSYFPLLRDAGWEPSLIEVSGGVISPMNMLRAAARAHVVVVVRRTLPVTVTRLLRAAARRLVFDFDDAVFNTPRGPSATRSRRFEAITRRCDQVWAGNDYLLEKARAHCRDVRCLPTVVDPPAYPTDVPKPSDSIDLVWIGGSSTRTYLEKAIPPLETAAQRIAQLRLKIIADFALSTNRLPVVAVPWSGETEARDLAASHIGIAPMPDSDWTRGKCGLKVLQYMAASLPVISSPVGANERIVCDNETGLLADGDAAWTEAVVRLAKDAPLRARLGAAGRTRVEQHYALNLTAGQMVDQINELADN